MANDRYLPKEASKTVPGFQPGYFYVPAERQPQEVERRGRKTGRSCHPGPRPFKRTELSNLCLMVMRLLGQFRVLPTQARAYAPGAFCLSAFSEPPLPRRSGFCKPGDCPSWRSHRCAGAGFYLHSRPRDQPTVETVCSAVSRRQQPVHQVNGEGEAAERWLKLASCA